MLSEAPLGSPLSTDTIISVLNSLKLDTYILFLKEEKKLILQTFNKALVQIDKHCYDYTAIKSSVIRKVPIYHLEAVSYLDS